MIGLDTNVLVRYFVQDDEVQAALATELVASLSAETPGYVSVVSLTELSWVLARSYGLGRERVVSAIQALLDSREIVVDRADAVRRALNTYRTTTADPARALRGSRHGGHIRGAGPDTRAQLSRPTRVPLPYSGAKPSGGTSTASATIRPANARPPF